MSFKSNLPDLWHVNCIVSHLEELQLYQIHASSLWWKEDERVTSREQCENLCTQSFDITSITKSAAAPQTAGATFCEGQKRKLFSKLCLQGVSVALRLVCVCSSALVALLR